MKRKKRKISFVYELKLFSVVLVTTLVAVLILFSLFYSLKIVSGYGMMPSLRDKDVLVVKRISDIKRFEIVFLNKKSKGEFRRIIGLPGETIVFEDDILLVNHEPIDEKYLVDKINENQAKGKNFTEDFDLFGLQSLNEIPTGYYLVLGDNRPYTNDSRDYGLISEDMIGGKAIMRLWPIERAEQFF